MTHKNAGKSSESKRIGGVIQGQLEKRHSSASARSMLSIMPQEVNLTLEFLAKRYSDNSMPLLEQLRASDRNGLPAWKLVEIRSFFPHRAFTLDLAADGNFYRPVEFGSEEYIKFTDEDFSKLDIEDLSSILKCLRSTRV